MNLILEPGLNATGERFGLFRIGNPKIPSNDRADLIRPPGSSQLPDRLEEQAPMYLANWEATVFLFFNVVTMFSLSGLTPAAQPRPVAALDRAGCRVRPLVGQPGRV